MALRKRPGREEHTKERSESKGNTQQIRGAEVRAVVAVAQGFPPAQRPLPCELQQRLGQQRCLHGASGTKVSQHALEREKRLAEQGQARRKTEAGAGQADEEFAGRRGFTGRFYLCFLSGAGLIPHGFGRYSPDQILVY